MPQIRFTLAATMNFRILPVLLLALSLSFAQGTERSPNIVLLIADDLGYGELGIQGRVSDIPTPHIDSIGHDGVRFTNGYVTAPFCAASRAGLITGRYQTRFGFEFNPIGPRNEEPDAGLPESQETLADILRDQKGYATALIGKWHLGGTARYNPIRRGFDEFFGFLHEGHYFVPSPYHGTTTWLRRKALPGGTTDSQRWTSRDGKLVLTTHMGHNEPDYDADNPIYRNGQPVEESEYLTDALTREATAFIDHHAERPFFLCLAYNAVHSPLQGADAYMEKFASIEDIQRRIFAAMLANLDDSVGAVLGSLDKNQLTRDTLIFFLSDNGGPTRELTSSNLPLRGEKGQLYEGGIRVPILASWPGTIPAGQTSDAPITSLDIFTTATTITGTAAPKSQSLDGIDLLPHLAESAAIPERPLFWRVGNRTALRLGDWKIVRQPERGKGSSATVEWQLFHLANDIGETKNLATEHPDKVNELKVHWDRINAEMIDPVF